MSSYYREKSRKDSLVGWRWRLQSVALGDRLAGEARRRQVNQGTPAWGRLSVGAAHACAGVCLPACSAGGKSVCAPVYV